MRVDAPRGRRACGARRPRPAAGSRRSDRRDQVRAATICATSSSARARARRRCASRSGRSLARCSRELGITIASRVVRIGGVVDATPWRDVRAGRDRRVAGARARSGRRGGDGRARSRARRPPATRWAACSRSSRSGVPVALGSYVQWDRRLEGEVAQDVHVAQRDQRRRDRARLRRGGGCAGSQAHDEYEPATATRTRYRTQPRRRHRGRDDDRPADRRARGDEADRDADEAARLGRSAHGRGDDARTSSAATPARSPPPR